MSNPKPHDSSPCAVLGELITDRLRLRPVTVEDVELLLDLDSDPEVMRYLTNSRPSTAAEVVDTIKRRHDCRWIAYRRDTSEFIGWFGLVPRGDGVYDLGYRLKRAHWGFGFATEGGEILIDAAIRRLHAGKVIAETMAVNTRSRAVMERLGMRHARTWYGEWEDPIPGSELGEVVYEILPTGEPPSQQFSMDS